MPENIQHQIEALQAEVDAAITRRDYKETLRLSLILSAKHVERSALYRSLE